MKGLPVSFPLAEGRMTIAGLAFFSKLVNSKSRPRSPSVMVFPTETGTAGSLPAAVDS